MTVYTKTMAQALREVYLVEDNMEQMRKAAGGAMQTIKFRDGKLKVDSFTASAIMKVYDAVNSKNKKSMENIINKGTKSQMMKLQSFAMKQIKSELQYAAYDPEDKGPLATVDEGAALKKFYKDQEEKRKNEIDDWAAAKKADLKKEHSNGKPHKHPHDDEEDEDEIDQQQQQNAQEAAGTVNLKSPVMLDLLRLYNKAMSVPPGSKKQKEYKKEIEKVRKSMGMTEDVSVVVDAEELTEGTWHIAKDMSGLKILMKKPIKLGNEGDDATEVISPFIGDDQLYDALYASGKKNPNGDARPVIKKAMKRLRIREEVEEAVTAKNYDKKRNEFTQGIIGKIKNDNEAVKTLMKELGVSKKGAMDMVKQTRAAYKDEDRQQTDEGEKKGLWHNIHKKRERGEKMRKKGDPGAPSDADIKRSQEEVEEGKLPSHLAKFFDPKTGDMKPEVAKRVKKIRNKSKIKDVTPKGYGPKEEVELDEKENSYTVVHVKKGKEVVKAKSSYEAAKKFAQMKGLKNTSGVDAHLMEEVELNEVAGTFTIVANGISDLKKADKQYLEDTEYSIAAGLAEDGVELDEEGVSYKGNSIMILSDNEDMRMVQSWAKNQTKLAADTVKMIKPKMDYNDLYEERADHLYVAALLTNTAKPNKAPKYTVKFMKEEVELNEGSMHDVIVMKKGRVGVGVIATDIASIKKKEKQGWKIEGVIEKGSKILHKEPKRIMKAIKGGDKLNIGEARQLKDPKKEMMVKSKDSGVIVIDKKDFKKYQKKGYFQVEEVELDEAADMEASGKVVAKNMMMVKSMKPYASKVAKMKTVSGIDLERMLPHDKVSVKEIDGVMSKSMNEEVDLDEGKMNQMHQMMKDGKSAEQIAKAMKLDLKTVRELMKEGLGNIAKAGAKAVARGAKGAVKTAYKASPIGQWHGAVKTGVKKVKDVAGRVKQASQKGEEFDPVEEGAAADARRAIGRDPQLGRKKDSADDDMSATDDDVKAASKNIMMQLRKSQTLRGKFDVEFMDRKKHKVPPKIAQAVTARFMALKRPAEKQEFQNKISKSYKDMLKALDEAINNEGFIFIHKKQTILERIDGKLMERKNG